jgi:PAS domain S-box-containing protein
MAANTPNAILIIDDDANLLAGLRRNIAGQYALDTFTDPHAALTSLRQGPMYAVVISDMRMPQMDGFTFLRQVHRLCPESVCVILTGANEQGPAVQAVNDGHIFRFLKKPCSRDELSRVIEQACQEYRNRCLRNGFLYRLTKNEQGPALMEAEAGVWAVTGYRGIDLAEQPFRWKDMTLPEDRFNVQAFYERAWAGVLPDPLEHRLCRKDGSVIWVRNTLLNRYVHGDMTLTIEGQIQDITEQKRIERNLEQARRLFEKIVANVPGLVFQCRIQSSGDFAFTFVSHSCLRLLGVTSEQLLMDSSLLFQAFSSDDRSSFFSKLAESAEQLSSLVWQGRHIRGDTERWFQITAQPERLADGQVLWDGLLMDITEQKKSEQHAEFLAQISNENPTPVLRVNEQGRIIYANDAAAPLLTLWHRQVSQLLPQDIYEIVLKASEGGRPITVEQRCVDHYYSIIFSPVRDSTDVNLYARDITKIKIAELELRNANQVLIEHERLKSEFVSTVTHELRTPLCIFRNILSNALAGVHGPISKRLRENLEMAQSGVERLSRIILDFLDVNKIEAGSLQLEVDLCSLNDVVLETCRSLKLLAAAKKIKIKTDMPGGDCPAWIDRDRIVQVLVNLIGNAIKFIPIRGHITVRLETLEESFKISVQDDGPGLTPEEMARVFDRFVQIKTLKGPGRHGTGLGLTISRELVRLHGGRIHVDSEPGKGCTFWFTLPRTAKSQGSEPAIIASSPGHDC